MIVFIDIGSYLYIDSTKCVKMLSSILQELLPDFWAMSQCFYREEYHTQANLVASSLLTQDEIHRVFEKYVFILFLTFSIFLTFNL